MLVKLKVAWISIYGIRNLSRERRSGAGEMLRSHRSWPTQKVGLTVSETSSLTQNLTVHEVIQCRMFESEN